MNFIKSIVRPCFESLSSHDYLIHRNNSIIGRQLQENELTWEMTRVDQDTGLLIVPDKDEIEKLVIERRKIEQFDHVPIKEICLTLTFVLNPFGLFDTTWLLYQYS